MIRHLPNALTLFRIGVIPAIALCLWTSWHQAAFWLFLTAMASDFFDGMAARWLNRSSRLGQMLDPIADKVLASCILLLLAAEQTVAGWHIIPALIILSREVLVSGLREYLAGLNVSLPVTLATKIKTAVQFSALGLLVLGPALPAESRSVILLGGNALLWLAAAMTAYTGYAYVQASLTHLDAAENGRHQ